MGLALHRSAVSDGLNRSRNARPASGTEPSPTLPLPSPAQLPQGEPQHYALISQ